MRWTVCWKCNKDIKNRAGCYYVKCRNGSFNFCSDCYTEFLALAEPSLQLSRIEENKVLKLVLDGIALLHKKTHPGIFQTCTYCDYIQLKFEEIRLRHFKD